MDREKMVKTIKSPSSCWDLLVIGGGAIGLGIAVESASRGYRTLLLEQGDFAQGTSSSSTKLIHGGLRYLLQGNFPLVRTALHERAFLLSNAPHLVKPLPFVVPTNSLYQQLYYAAGLKTYDWLAGGLRLTPSQWLSASTMAQIFPAIPALKGITGVRYWDAQFDDTRLAINLAQTAVEWGASVINYFSVVGLLKDNERVCGVVAKDEESRELYEIRSKVVVNAAGPFASGIQQLDSSSTGDDNILCQGSHIVLNKEFFPSESALIIPKTSDGRLLFVIPWYDRVLIGTTEKILTSPTHTPKPSPQEIQYLLEHASSYLCSPPRPEEICGAFAGIRVLQKSHGKWRGSAALSRAHGVVVSPSQLVTVVGGKWTIYRHVAENIVDTAASIAGLPAQCSISKDLKIHGWLPTDLIANMQNSPWNYYGSDCPDVERLAAGDLRKLEPIHPSLPCREVDVLWAVQYEMARQVEDVLMRRGRSLLLGARESLTIAPRVAAIMAKALGRDLTWQRTQIDHYQKTKGVTWLY